MSEHCSPGFLHVNALPSTTKKSAFCFDSFFSSLNCFKWDVKYTRSLTHELIYCHFFQPLLQSSHQPNEAAVNAVTSYLLYLDTSLQYGKRYKHTVLHVVDTETVSTANHPSNHRQHMSAFLLICYVDADVLMQILPRTRSL